MTPYWQAQGLALYCGDALEVMRAMPATSVDAIITDPPYNIGYHYDGYRDRRPWPEYEAWQRAVLVEGTGLLRDGGSLLYLNYPEFAAKLFWTIPGLAPIKLLAWVYHAHSTGWPLRRATRLWCWWAKGRPAYIGDGAIRSQYRNPNDRRVRRLIANGRRPTDYDWWHYEQVKNVSRDKTSHPCQLPEPMVRRLVQMVAPPGGMVLDPFAGSGTVLVAAARSSRRAIGIEIEERYCDLAARRLEAELRQCRFAWEETP